MAVVKGLSTISKYLRKGFNIADTHPVLLTGPDAERWERENDARVSDNERCSTHRRVE